MIEPVDERRGFFVFSRRPSVAEGSTNPNDLFDLRDIHVAVVDGISYSGDGGEDGLVGGDVVRELDGVSGSAKWLWWCLNGGTRTWNGQHVFLVGVVKLVGSGLVWVRKPDAGNVGGPIFADSEEPCEALLDSGVLLRRAYWTFGSICGSRAWRYGEWSSIFFDDDGGFGVRGIGHG